jgi:hypothetical protein
LRWQTHRDYDESRRLGKAAKRSLEEVFDGWDGPDLPADERAVHEGIEAQIAAAALGHKPLYFDPWGGEASELLAEALKPRMPADVEIHATDDNLLIYCPDVVRPILDADPAFYRPNGENDLAAIARVSTLGQNGELLGYGARNPYIPHGAKVTIRNEAGYIQVFFVSIPEEAEKWAVERAADVEAYTGQPVTIEIIKP